MLLRPCSRSFNQHTILRRLGEMGEKNIFLSFHFLQDRMKWKWCPYSFYQLLLPLRSPITSHIMMMAMWFRLSSFTLQSVLARLIEWYKSYFSLLLEGNVRVKSYGEIHRGIKFSNTLTNFLQELNFQQLFMDLSPASLTPIHQIQAILWSQSEQKSKTGMRSTILPLKPTINLSFIWPGHVLGDHVHVLYYHGVPDNCGRVLLWLGQLWGLEGGALCPVK